MLYVREDIPTDLIKIGFYVEEKSLISCSQNLETRLAIT